MREDESLATKGRRRAAVLMNIRQAFGIPEITALAPGVEAWFESPLGQSLLEREQAMIDQTLGVMFGYHLMQLSIDRRIELFGNSKINHKFGFHPMASDGKVNTGLCQFEQLPLEKRVVDVALVHHVLDYSTRPHRVLSEVVRSTVDHGHVIVVGFNPVSPMGLLRQSARFIQRKPHQRSNAITSARVVDWLRVLSCEPIKVETGHFQWPINSTTVLKSTRWLEPFGQRALRPFGSFYMVVARKETGGAIPVRPQWQAERPKLGIAVGGAVARHSGQRPAVAKTGHLKLVE